MNLPRNQSDYWPIPCASYDQYEIAILHRRRMHLVWEDGNVVYDQVVIPLNLRTTEGQEFLLLKQENGDTREVRLDHIRRADTL